MQPRQKRTVDVWGTLNGWPDRTGASS